PGVCGRGVADGLPGGRLAAIAGGDGGRQEGPRLAAAAGRARRARPAGHSRRPAGGSAGAGLRGGVRGMRQVLVLNGPNLGRLGSREPEVYGSASFADLTVACQQAGRELGLDVQVRQTDDEAELVSWGDGAADSRTPIVLNPAAFTHYSYALRDALAMRTAPLIEVHMSNPAARESFRQLSVVSGVADGTIAGFGLLSYRLARRAVAELSAGDQA